MSGDSEYDYQDDSDEDEEQTVGVTCIKAMPHQRESVVCGDGQGNITIFDTRTKRGSALGLFSRGDIGQVGASASS